jgi:glutathione peroxidase
VASFAPMSTRTPRLPSVLLVLLAAGAACKANDAANSAPSVSPSAPAAASAAASSTIAAAAPAAASPGAAPAAGNGTEPAAGSIYALTMTRLDGTPGPLSSWAGQVLLIVNTASKCGYTPQYEGLQALHAKYSPRGFAVLGFPSNDFGGQEPGSAKEISTFCTSIYAVNFPMFEKTKVIGQERSPLYALLSDAYGAPKWNFHKYLIDKHGKPVQAWPSAVTPGAAELSGAIEAQLALQ